MTHNILFGILWLVQTIITVAWLWRLEGSVICHRKMIAKLMFKTDTEIN